MLSTRKLATAPNQPTEEVTCATRFSLLRRDVITLLSVLFFEHCCQAFIVVDADLRDWSTRRCSSKAHHLNIDIAVTNARFASLHGLPVAPPPRRRPFHFANPRARHELAWRSA